MLIIKLSLKLKFTMNVVVIQKSSNKRIYIWSNIHIMGERIETGGELRQSLSIKLGFQWLTANLYRRIKLHLQ